MELHRTVYRSEERAIEPPATSRDQLWNLTGRSDWSGWVNRRKKIDANLIRHVSNGVRGFDVVKKPRAAALRHKFPG
jgi:hypothetical protein